MKNFSHKWNVFCCFENTVYAYNKFNLFIIFVFTFNFKQIEGYKDYKFSDLYFHTCYKLLTCYAFVENNNRLSKSITIKKSQHNVYGATDLFFYTATTNKPHTC